MKHDLYSETSSIYIYKYIVQDDLYTKVCRKTIYLHNGV